MTHFRWILLGAGLAGWARAQAQLDIGPRALGMGGAFTAVADDSTAAYWNPAGLTQLKHPRIGALATQFRLDGPYTLSDLANHIPTGDSARIELAKRFGADVTHVSASGFAGFATGRFAVSVLPFAAGAATPTFHNGAGKTTIGFHYDANGSPVPGDTATFNGAVGYEALVSAPFRVGAKTTVGFNAKWINSQAQFARVDYTEEEDAAFHAQTGSAISGSDAASVPVTTSTGSGARRTTVGADIGVLHRLTPEISLGAMARNVIKPSVDQLDTSTTLSLGAAYRPLGRRMVVAADFAGIGNSSRLNVGAEFSVARMVSARAGIYRGKPTLGLGLMNILNVAYSTDHRLLAVSLSL